MRSRHSAQHIRPVLRRVRLNPPHVNGDAAFIQFSAYPGRGLPPEHPFSRAIAAAEQVIAARKVKSDTRDFTDYQKAAIAFFMELEPDASGGRKGAIYDPMGVGKTPTAIGIAMALGPQAFPIVIMRPKAADSAWGSDFKEWWGLPVLEAKPNADGSWITPAAMQGKEVLAITPESISPYADTGWQEGDWSDAVYQKTKAKGGGLLIIDEAHFLRGHNSSRTIAASRLAQVFPNLLIMTGTPGLKSALEAVGILEVLGRSVPLREKTWQRHAVTPQEFEDAQNTLLRTFDRFQVSGRVPRAQDSNALMDRGALFDFVDPLEATVMSSALRRRGVRRSRQSIEAANAQMAGGRSFLQQVKRRVPVVVPLTRAQTAIVDNYTLRPDADDLIGRFSRVMGQVERDMATAIQAGRTPEEAVSIATNRAMDAARRLYIARPLALQQLYREVTRQPAVDIAVDLLSPARGRESSVIFTQTNEEAREIFDLLAAHPGADEAILIRFNSSASRIREPGTQERKFKSHITDVQSRVRQEDDGQGHLKKPLVLVITMDSAQVGLNLQQINYVIMPDRADTPGIEEQAEDRINRATRKPFQPLPTIIYLVPAEPFALAMAHRQENRRLNLRYMFGPPPEELLLRRDPQGGHTMFQYGGKLYTRSPEFAANDDNTEPLPLPASRMSRAGGRAPQLAAIYEFVRDPKAFVTGMAPAVLANIERLRIEAEAAAERERIRAEQAERVAEMRRKYDETEREKTERRKEVATSYPATPEQKKALVSSLARAGHQDYRTPAKGTLIKPDGTLLEGDITVEEIGRPEFYVDGEGPYLLKDVAMWHIESPSGTAGPWAHPSIDQIALLQNGKRRRRK